MKEISSIVVVIIGALIGAGFASGQEIYSFFFCYGINGIIGIAITAILTAILIYKILKIVCVFKIDNYKQFLSQILNNSKIIEIINNILNILLLITFFIMVAGFGAFSEQEVGIPKIIGSLIFLILCSIVFFTNVKGVLKTSEYLVPILIIFIMIIGTINFFDIEKFDFIEQKKGWILSSITYCSYNIILLIPVLISLRKLIKKEKNIKYISIFSGMIIFILSIMIYFLLMKSNINISKLEMPIVYIIGKFYRKFNIIYAFIILVSIFTTAISIGTGFLQNTVKNKKSYPQIVVFMCISSLLFSNIGFSKLVNSIYPIFGYVGIIQILLILSKNICKKKCL